MVKRLSLGNNIAVRDGTEAGETVFSIADLHLATCAGFGRGQTQAANLQGNPVHQGQTNSRKPIEPIEPIRTNRIRTNGSDSIDPRINPSTLQKPPPLRR